MCGGKWERDGATGLRYPRYAFLFFGVFLKPYQTEKALRNECVRSETSGFHDT